jgi:hypothetical protein
MNAEAIIQVIRGLVRPIVTFLVILALAVIVVYLVVKFADLEMAKDVLSAFLVLVASITGYWFGSRKSSG